MTTTNAELRALAEQATPGPWTSDIHPSGMVVCSDGPVHHTEICETQWQRLIDPVANPDQARRNAAYIAAASPTRIIELLNELEHYERPTRELARKAEPAQMLTQLQISLNLALADNRDLRAKLDIALRALSEIYDEGRGQLSAYALQTIAQQALAQIKEQS